MIDRLKYKKIWQELAAEKSMILLAGPRQAGKTTFARAVAADYASSLYFNWDIPSHREKLIANKTFFEEVERRGDGNPLIILDEIHKYRDWKNYLKGVYDQLHESYQFLVSGSGRLDLYQKGGDSLAGRYLLFHLWPLTLAESVTDGPEFEQFIADPLSVSMGSTPELRATWEQLAITGGFPEPFIAGKQTAWRRWSNSYARQLIREDIRELTDIKSATALETLYQLLPGRVGSPLSTPALSRDLQVAYNTAQGWLAILERFYMIFSITPWTARIARAIQKERKVYLFDTPRITDQGARFENMVAIELYRAVSNWNDMGYGNFSLHFIKNKEQQETDFLLARDNEPFLLVEAKLSDIQPSTPLRKFQQMLEVPAVQLVNIGEGHRLFSNADYRILVAPAWQWLAALP